MLKILENLVKLAREFWQLHPKLNTQIGRTVILSGKPEQMSLVETFGSAPPPDGGASFAVAWKC
mgnify:CR=1 FL=1